MGASVLSMCEMGDAATLGQLVTPGGQSRNDSTSVPSDVADSAASGHKRKSIGPDQLTAVLMRAPFASDPWPRVASMPTRCPPADDPIAPMCVDRSCTA